MDCGPGRAQEQKYICRKKKDAHFMWCAKKKPADVRIFSSPAGDEPGSEGKPTQGGRPPPLHLLVANPVQGGEDTSGHQESSDSGQVGARGESAQHDREPLKATQKGRPRQHGQRGRERAASRPRRNAEN